jgi:hypothetical protein
MSLYYTQADWQTEPRRFPALQRPSALVLALAFACGSGGETATVDFFLQSRRARIHS